MARPHTAVTRAQGEIIRIDTGRDLNDSKGDRHEQTQIPAHRSQIATRRELTMGTSKLESAIEDTSAQARRRDPAAKTSMDAAPESSRSESGIEAIRARVAKEETTKPSKSKPGGSSRKRKRPFVL